MTRETDVRPSAHEPLITYDVESTERLSDAILSASTDVVDDLISLRPLASIIDVDSLDNLFEARRDVNSNSADRVIAFAAWDLWFVVTGVAVEIYDLDTPLDT